LADLLIQCRIFHNGVLHYRYTDLTFGVLLVLLAGWNKTYSPESDNKFTLCYKLQYLF
jgi:hypothetical protein